MKWIIICLVIGLVFLTGCSENVAETPIYGTTPQTFVTVEIDHSTLKDPYAAQTYTIEKKKTDLFEKWKESNAQREAQDRWDAMRGEDEDTLVVGSSDFSNSAYQDNECGYNRECY